MAFIDRSVEHPGRVVLTPTGTENEYDLTRSEGEVYEEGTALNASNLNDEIANAVDDALATEMDGIAVTEIQTGRIIMSPKANSTVKAVVKFPKPFSAVPNVVATAMTSVPHIVDVAVSNVTATQFEVYFYRTNTTRTTVMWVAMR